MHGSRKAAFLPLPNEVNIFSKDRLWGFFPLGSSSKGWEQKKELNQQWGKIFDIKDSGSEEECESYKEAV